MQPVGHTPSLLPLIVRTREASSKKKTTRHEASRRKFKKLISMDFLQGKFRSYLEIDHSGPSELLNCIKDI